MTTSRQRAVGYGMEIHRLLDEAFSGIDVTPEVQDLKEEMRANLVVRVSELEGSGLPPAAAAQRAIGELGDIGPVVDEMETLSPGRSSWTHHRVRPRPGYVVRTVVTALVGVVALSVVTLPAFGIGVPAAAQLTAVAGFALVVGWLVGDALVQETTTNYPLPAGRAAGYGLATALLLAGAGSGVLYLRHLGLPWLVGGGLAVVASIVAFTLLGATQTNRHKPWVVRLRAEQAEVGDRFTHDPAAAARFGLYTVTIWTLAFAGFAVLSFTVGWAWSWLALVAGVVAMMVSLARTLFAERSSR